MPYPLKFEQQNLLGIPGGNMFFRSVNVGIPEEIIGLDASSMDATA